MLLSINLTTIRSTSKTLKNHGYSPRIIYLFIFVRNTYAYRNIMLKGKKGNAIPVTGRGGLYGCGTSRLPHFLDSRSQMAVRLSGLRGGRSLPPPPRRFPGTHLGLGLCRLQGHSARLEGLG
jgi:hypothetical protein